MEPLHWVAHPLNPQTMHFQKFIMSLLVQGCRMTRAKSNKYLLSKQCSAVGIFGKLNHIGADPVDPEKQWLSMHRYFHSTKWYSHLNKENASHKEKYYLLYRPLPIWLWLWPLQLVEPCALVGCRLLRKWWHFWKMKTTVTPVMTVSTKIKYNTGQHSQSL